MNASLGAAARRRRDVAAQAAGLALAFALATAFYLAPPLVMVESRARDMVHALFYPRAGVSEEVVLVTIGESALSGLPYRSPIDRNFLSTLIEALAEKRPAAIGIDLLFDRPTEPAKDAALRATLARHAGLPVVAGVARALDGLTERQLAWLSTYLHGLPTGHLLLLNDAGTGVARGVPRLRDPDGTVIPSLAEAMLGERASALRRGPMLLAYSPANNLADRRFPIFPAEMASRLPASWIEGSIVLIGVDLDGVDRLATPVSALRGGEQRPGVELHAQVLQQILDGRSLRETGYWEDLASTLIAALICAGAAATRFGVGYRVLLIVAALALIALTPALLLREIGVRAAVTPPMAAGLLAGGLMGAQRWSAETAARRRLREAFGRYLAPAVVAEIARAEEPPKLNGERREISCIFTDVAGFTSLSEALEPERLSSVLNRYLDGMTALFFAHGATLDKFIGDAVVGFIGAPTARFDHAAAAIRLAVDLDAFARDFASVARSEGVAFGVTRIGVHSGVAIVGNFGGDRFFDYTAIGDTMNTAARLEGANKAFGTRICISSRSIALAPDVSEMLMIRPICAVRLKGRKQYLDVYEAAARDAPPSRQLLRYRDAYAMLDSDPGRAWAAFTVLHAEAPDDPLLEFHLKRFGRGETGVKVILDEK